MDTRIGKKGAAFLLIMVAILAIFAAGCTTPTPTPGNVTSNATATPVPIVNNKDTLVVMQYGEPTSLDYMTDDGYESAGFEVVQECYETLFYYVGSDVTTPVPVLATGYDLSSDGLVYTIYLRPNVTFADGTAFNASAVKYSLDRLMLIDNGPAYSNFVGTIKGYAAYDATKPNTTQADVDAYLAAEGVKVINETTVQITLESSNSNFIKMLTFPACSIMSPTFDKKNGGFNATASQGNPYMAEHACGTGAYTLQDWQHKTAVTLVRNDNYWGEKAKTPKVILAQVDDWNTRLLAIQKGDADFVLVDALHAQDVRNDTNLVFETDKGTLLCGAIFFNFEIWPYNDAKVRQAFIESFDKNLYIDTATNGLAKRIEQPVPKGLVGGDNVIEKQAFNPTHAKQLLIEAGFTPANKTTLTLNYNKGNSNRQRICTMLAEQINSYESETGLHVNVQELAWAEYIPLMNQGKLGCFVVGWQADYPGADNFISAFLYSKGYYMVLTNNPGNATADALYMQSLKENDPVKQAALYKQITDIANANSTYCWTTQASEILCYRKGVNGAVWNPLNGGIGVNYAKVYK